MLTTTIDTINIPYRSIQAISSTCGAMWKPSEHFHCLFIDKGNDTLRFMFFGTLDQVSKYHGLETFDITPYYNTADLENYTYAANVDTFDKDEQAARFDAIRLRGELNQLNSIGYLGNVKATAQTIGAGKAGTSPGTRDVSYFDWTYTVGSDAAEATAIAIAHLNDYGYTEKLFPAPTL